MVQKESNVCSHCTYCNTPGRVRCSMCRRNIRKRPHDTSNDALSSPSPLKPSEENVNGHLIKGVVQTLFSTAAGTPVVVSESSIQAARMRLEGKSATTEVSPAQESGHSVQTLFSTASGTPVVVSESSIQAARMRLDGGVEKVASISTENSTVALSVSCVGGADGGAATPHLPAPAAEAVEARASLSKGSFVVPLARGPRERSSGVLSSTVIPSKKKSLRAISYDIFRFSSLAMSALPTAEDIVQERFAFKREGCSPELVRILGLSTTDITVSPNCFYTALLELGGTVTGIDVCLEDWCQQMLKSTLLKLRGLSLRCNPPLAVFSVSHSLLCICFKYNREFVQAERPALRIVTEGDVPASSLMVVTIVSLSLEERLAPHTSVGVISDGCYEIKVALDVPLTNLVREGILRRGQKILICGAKMLVKKFCSPLECRDDVVLSINYNCTRPVDADSALGLYNANPPIFSSASVHPLGGLVPSLRGTVERLLPTIFIEQSINRRGVANNGTRVIRNLLAQQKSLELVTRQMTEATPGSEVRETSGTSEDATSSRRLVRVSSLLLTCDTKEDVLLQLWEDVGDGCFANVLDDVATEFPAEGTVILVFAVTPSRSRPSHPFRNAKVLYTRGRLEYRQLSTVSGFSRQLQQSAEDIDSTTPAGAPMDFAAFFVSSTKTDSVISYVFALVDVTRQKAPSYFLMDVPCATPVKEIIISMPATSFTPVVVQNASFIRRADVDLGSDSLHVLANEYTRVLQRPAAPGLRAAVAVLEDCREKVKSMDSVSARAVELLRLRQLSDEARSGVRHFSSELSASEIPLMVETGAPSRVPYYMRSDARGSVSKGVSIPSSIVRPQVSHEQKAVIESEQKSVIMNKDKDIMLTKLYKRNGKSHFFGNILRMRMVRCFGSEKRECINLFTELDSSSTTASNEIKQSVPQEELVPDSTYFEIDIQFTAEVQHQVTVTIRNPSVLNAILEERVAVRSACALVVDEGQVDYFVMRNKLLEGWQYKPEESWWWLLSLSCVTNGEQVQSNTMLAMMVWLRSEWEQLLDMLAAGVRDSLYAFTINATENVTRVVFIKENCSLTDLMSE
ncbi:DNA repair protein BRCA2 [Trypanosoma theileri]|uniref:DNA repair protein BRCA2 n=1 Tax=Trypanosoma theileri TaxID=67003 RepID=A0A1X0NWJ4_9TRYP|nr:DNA repair protein BRCA2 [Trypanosoma theileri]ORC89086.1 DNA repair protein BRCA2 [Trypanosoma theileri]